MFSLPFPTNLLTDPQLATMLRHTDPEVRSEAEKEIRRRGLGGPVLLEDLPDARIDNLAVRPGRLQQPAQEELERRKTEQPITFESLRRFDRSGADREDARYRERLDQAKKRALKEGLPEASAQQVAALVSTHEIAGRFIRGPEAPEIAARILPFLAHEKIAALLRQAEEGGRLHRGFADQLDRARREANPYLGEFRNLARATGLPDMDPDLGALRRGRPSHRGLVVLAACLADLVNAVDPGRVWPVVAKLLGPTLRAARVNVSHQKGVAEGLRQWVGRNRRMAERAEAGRWEALKSRLRQRAGIKDEPNWQLLEPLTPPPRMSLT